MRASESDRYLLTLLATVRWRLVRQSLWSALSNIAAVSFALLMGAAVSRAVEGSSALWWFAAGALGLGLVEATRTPSSPAPPAH